MALTPADVSRIAELARLELSGAEADAMLASSTTSSASSSR
jgi:Asp-tRNA(Asn)/Glu-tRNA(Gln) amidotransferase C subunit